MPVVSFESGDIAISTVPQLITAYQAENALDDAGLLDAVQALINHPDTPSRIRSAWRRGLDLQRNNQMVALIAQQLGLSDAQLDELFIAANKIKAGEL